ncbi:hypothetical protein AX14_007684 [Amanita brunnescens Koide BX004]|nr:hypothetical protein AX14_007684 [Amanita brunnescens Koide BX004]
MTTQRPSSQPKKSTACPTTFKFISEFRSHSTSTKIKTPNSTHITSTTRDVSPVPSRPLSSASQSPLHNPHSEPAPTSPTTPRRALRPLPALPSAHPKRPLPLARLRAADLHRPPLGLAPPARRAPARPPEARAADRVSVARLPVRGDERGLAGKARGVGAGAPGGGRPWVRAVPPEGVFQEGRAGPAFEGLSEGGVVMWVRAVTVVRAHRLRKGRI